MTVTLPRPGALTDTSVKVYAEVAAGASCRLAWSTNSGLTSPTYSSSASADSDGTVHLAATGLTANTQYYYGIEEAGVLDPIRGKFRTCPPSGASASWVMVHSSCTSYYDVAPSNHRVYDAMRGEDPLIMLLPGDHHYGDITANTASLFRAKTLASLGTARASAMLKDTALAIVEDDHDGAGGDNGDGTATAWPAFTTAFQQCLPLYSLPDSNAAYQAFTVGNKRFVMTDLRRYRSPNGNTDNSSKTMLGATQLAWLLAELSSIKTSGLKPYWISTQVPCVASSGWSGLDTDGDHWGAFSTERAVIWNHMAAIGMNDLTIITGDQHALGIRRSVDYSTAQTAPARVYCAAAIDALPVTRNGGWDSVSAGRGQYGKFTFTSHGSWETVLWEGFQVDPSTGSKTLIMSDSFTIGTPPAAGQNYAVKVGGVARPIKVEGAARPFAPVA